jgi:IS5 family transposase
MKCSNGFEQCYNTQLAVDEAHGVLVAADVSQVAADSQQLEPMIDSVERNTGRTPRRVLADAGYRSDANFHSLEQRNIDGYIALGRGDEAPAAAGWTPATARMARKLRMQQGRRRYRKRKHIAEPPFGWIKAVLGFRQFSLRGLKKVKAEWQLVCLAANLRRMNRMMAWT